MVYLLSSLTSEWAAELLCYANEYSSVSCWNDLEIATYVHLPCRTPDCLDQSFCPRLKCNPLPFPQLALVPGFSGMCDTTLLPNKI